MVHSRFDRFAKALALSFTLTLAAGSAAEAQVMRDHRGPSGMSGGVMVSKTPTRYGYGRNQVIHDHRAGCQPTRQVPRPCGIPRLGRTF